MLWVLIPRNVMYFYHEGLEGITILTYFMCFIEMMSKTKLFNPYFSSLTSCSSWWKTSYKLDKEFIINIVLHQNPILCDLPCFFKVDTFSG